MIFWSGLPFASVPHIAPMKYPGKAAELRLSCCRGGVLSRVQESCVVGIRGKQTRERDRPRMVVVGNKKEKNKLWGQNQEGEKGH